MIEITCASMDLSFLFYADLLVWLKKVAYCRGADKIRFFVVQFNVSGGK